jgi:hypothetical protein
VPKAASKIILITVTAMARIAADKNPEVLNKFLGTEVDSEEIIITLKGYWEKNYDQRLGQLLLNNELTENGSVWHVEEVDWLIENEYLKFEDLNFWGINYDKDGNRLPETQFKLLKDLDLNHIKNIIKWYQDKGLYLNLKYTEYFNKRIEENKYWKTLK